MTFKKNLITAIATGAVLLNALAPMAFASDVIVTGNGASATDTVNLNNNSSTAVSQSNNATVTNVVNSNSNTGGNSAGLNTGGNVTVNTGSATSAVAVDTAVNKNVASLECGCVTGGGNASVTIDGNGALSTNTANVNQNRTTTLGQGNTANVVNVVGANSNSGGNSSGLNTGGNTTINTGAATTLVHVATTANANFATLGGGSATAGNGSSVRIVGNGALSTNTVNFNQNSALALSQSNNANVRNDVNGNSNTGGNSAGLNTGGDVMINTGAAKTEVSVDNLVNFNSANVSCDCITGGFGLLKLGGNGALSINKINANDNSSSSFGQGSNAALVNAVNGNSNAGTNDISLSTGRAGGDPSVNTGSATSHTSVSNTANANVLNNVGVSFDVTSLWSLLFGWFA